MRPVIYLMAALAVLGLAFWAYRENYRTQAQIDRMQAVQNEIAGLRDNLGVLRAEWAYLNRPERLRELVDINFDRLRLAPVQANQFGTTRNVDYPDPSLTPPDPAAPGDPTQPFVSNNRGAPKPRPLRSAEGVDGADGAAEAMPADAPAEDAIPADPDADPPADTAITETDTAPSQAPPSQE